MTGGSSAGASEVEDFFRNDHYTHDTFWLPFLAFDLPVIQRMSCSGGPLPLGALKSSTDNKNLKVYIELGGDERLGAFEDPREMPEVSLTLLLC